MDAKTVERIIQETAYTRLGGSPEELKTAQYLQAECKKFGCGAVFEPFEVDMAAISHAKLIADGKEIPCKGYLLCGSGTVEAPLYYLTDTSPYSLSLCKGKIVLIDGVLGYWIYHDLLENGAVGYITYDGNANYPDRNIDQKELRGYVSCGVKCLGVNINAKDAIALVANRVKTVRIEIQQTETKGTSQNVVLDLPGEVEEYIVLSAHYDSTSLSLGSYDNISGCIGLLALAEHFSQHPHRYGLRFIWCGSEERGLLGSKFYCASHEDLLPKIVFDINMDMLSCIMGKFTARCTSEEKLVNYMQYFASEMGYGCYVSQAVCSTDSTPFADRGIPTVSFARIAPANTATIHESYDTPAVMSPQQMVEDIAFVQAFVERMANAKYFPVARKIPDNMKEKLDEYLARKRPKT